MDNGGSRDAGRDGRDLLEQLGVTAQVAEHLDAQIIEEAQQKLTEENAEVDTSDGEEQEEEEEAGQSALEVVEKEIQVICAAISDQDGVESLGFQASEISAGTSTSRELQGATLKERLTALELRRRKLQEAERNGNACEGASGMPVEKTATGLVETEKDKLIRMGILTPFASIHGFERKIKSADCEEEESGSEEGSEEDDSGDDYSSDEEKEWPSAEDVRRKYSESLKNWKESRPQTKLVDMKELPEREAAIQKIDPTFWHRNASCVKRKRRREKPGQRRTRQKISERVPTTLRLKKNGKAIVKKKLAGGSESEYEPTDEVDSDSMEEDGEMEEPQAESKPNVTSRMDDGVDDTYEERIAQLKPPYKDRRGVDYVEFDGGYRIPNDIYSRLLDYQKTGVKWMWELHTQKAGGIIGDEMGLGKTVQVCSFLGGLHASGLFRPTLIMVPATVLRQWLQELRTWYPYFRVVILHASAKRGAGPKRTRVQLIDKIANSSNGVLLTTYEHMRIYQREFLSVDWGYVVLDEGHKIRNPDAEITLACKQVRTVHRLIMTGSPIQNRLMELWSLFDFVFPGKLGTLPVFQTQFSLPIQIGGYTNASQLQVSTAYKCAVVLRDLISPYILHRRKADVKLQLPEKTEQILFCSLTKEQRELYRAYIHSKDVIEIINKKRHALAGIDVMRKICNHPDLLDLAKSEISEDYGDPERSGKMAIMAKVLKHWKEEGHKVLLFSQTQQMLDIFEKFAQKEGYVYHRMDGSTSIGIRGTMMDDFNENPDIFLFLLTTKVGGLGVNLTGANRVLLYDPDWNPSTDIQARERSWRIGQTRDVTIYRLITSGTIEEKIYHRQVYKQFLTNKVLRDPKQKRFFTSKDMRDLFQLGDEKPETETAKIFQSVDGEILPDSAQSLADPGAGKGGNSTSTEKKLSQAGPSSVEGASNSPGSTDAKSPNKSSESGEGSDAGILRALFDKGVKGAIDHSKIESANDPEVIAVNIEASKIAREAMERLRDSRQLCEMNSVEVPTWTGRSGESGAPGAGCRFGGALNPKFGGTQLGGGGQSGTGIFKRSGAPTSSSILSQMRSRKNGAISAGRDSGGPSRSTPAGSPSKSVLADRWMRQVVTFLCRRGGEASSSEVISHFQKEVSPENMALFRSILKQVATLHRKQKGGVWVIKNEFK
ncbi:hypothetical protein BSKO_11614 [Bryopsis sp. KO-2023]|nr:hypothetical protein BSKO_11614 [Bryopsis sp. KO-2023]